MTEREREGGRDPTGQKRIGSGVRGDVLPFDGDLVAHFTAAAVGQPAPPTHTQERASKRGKRDAQIEREQPVIQQA